MERVKAPGWATVTDTVAELAVTAPAFALTLAELFAVPVPAPPVKVTAMFVLTPGAMDAKIPVHVKAPEPVLVGAGLALEYVNLVESNVSVTFTPVNVVLPVFTTCKLYCTSPPTEACPPDGETSVFVMDIPAVLFAIVAVALVASVASVVST